GQAVVVGWRRLVPVRQTAGAGAIRLAAGRGRRGGTESGAALNAARGDRLADAAANMAAGAGRLSFTGDRLRQIDSTYGLSDARGCGSDPLRACRSRPTICLRIPQH